MAALSRTFRIFVSSTFADLSAERNALQQIVFPRLRDLCNLHQCRFQAIDLRWGVREEAALDQQTMRICLEEVRRSQRTTPRPNFLVLLGDRYGWRPLPMEIPASEFEIVAARTSHPMDRELLFDWYRRDENAFPEPAYCLRPRIPGTSAQAIEEESRLWSRTERELRRILQSALREAGLPEDALVKYFASATEQEILEGALRAEGAEEHVFCFLRRIRNLEAALQDKAAQDFLDFTDRGGMFEPDHDARGRLDDLKRRRLPLRLPGNLHHYEADWTGAGITTDHIGSLPGNLEGCLKLLDPDRPASGFCADVWRRLAGVILGTIRTLEVSDPLREEISAHMNFGRGRAASFVGRQSALDALLGYVRGSSRAPFAIVGAGGSGKSALLARAAELLRGHSPRAFLCQRFIGATPASAEGRSLLEGLCRELGREYSAEEQLESAEYRFLADEFPKRLALATPEKPLILLVDALDQLSAADGARSLLWLPPQLPENVKVIVSTLPGDAAGLLRNKLPAENLLRLEPMDLEEGHALLQLWLRQAGRTLQPWQSDLVLSGFHKSGLPLYLKLAFEEARRWRSDAAPERCELGAGVEDQVRRLFQRLASESEHGEILVSRSLGYLGAAKNGLSEDELVDVLSANPEVLHDFVARARHEPPEPRLPIVVWSRLYFDLEPYLALRSADGSCLITFFHRQLGEVAREMYLKEARLPRHRELASYFEKQPLLRVHEGAAVPNLRKLAETPYQQISGETWEAAEDTLASFAFLHVKAGAGMAYEAAEDYELLRERYLDTGREFDDAVLTRKALFRDFASAYHQEMYAFLARPEIAAQQMYNNLLAHSGWEGRTGEVLKAFAVTRDYPGSRPWLRRLNSGPDTSTSRLLLRTLTGHDQPVTAVAVSSSGDWIASGSARGEIRVWNSTDGSVAARFQAHAGEVSGLSWIPGQADSFELASAGRDQWIRVWDWRAERAVLARKSGHSRIRAIQILADGRRAITCGDDGAVRILDFRTGVEEAVLRGHKDRVWTVSASGRLAISGSDDKNLMLWDLENRGPGRALRASEAAVRAVALAPGEAAAISGGDDGALRIWDVPAGKQIHSVAAHRQRIAGVALAAKAGIVATAGDDEIIKLWDAHSGEQKGSLRGHTGPVRCLVPDPLERWVASGGEDRTVRVWGLTPASAASPSCREHEAAVACLASGDGFFVSGSEDCSLRAWDGADGSCLLAYRGHVGPVTCAAVLDETRFVSGSADRTIKVWNQRTGALERSLGAPFSNALLQAAGSSASLPQSLRSEPGHANVVTQVCCAGGSRILSASRDATVRLWDAATGAQLSLFAGAGGPLECLQYSGEHGILAAAGVEREVFLWRPGDSQPFARLRGHEGSVTALAVSGNTLVSCGMDRTLRAWPLTGAGRETVLTGHQDRINCVALDSASGLAASGGQDLTVRLWELETGSQLAVLRGHSAPVRDVLLDASAGRAVSAGDDGCVFVWNLESGAARAVAFLGAACRRLLFATEGCVVAGTRTGGVVVLKCEE